MYRRRKPLEVGSRIKFKRSDSFGEVKYVLVLKTVEVLTPCGPVEQRVEGFRWSATEY